MELNDSTRHLVNVAATAAVDKLALNPVAIKVGERLAYSDVFLIVSAESHRQVQAVANAIEDEVMAAGGPRPKVEGREEASWVLLDFGDLVVHVQLDEQREFYALERLWADCPELEISEVELAK